MEGREAGRGLFQKLRQEELRYENKVLLVITRDSGLEVLSFDLKSKGNYLSPTPSNHQGSLVVSNRHQC